MYSFKHHLKEGVSKEEKNDNEVSQEQYVQNTLFGANDYIPFKMEDSDLKESELHESVEPHPFSNNRMVVHATPGENSAANGLIVPKHMWVGIQKSKLMGMKDRNEHRAKVYGSEPRQPLGRGGIEKIHKEALSEHFKKPISEQIKSEKEAVKRLQSAKHLDSGSTLDQGEKTDTINVEKDEKGRNFVAYGSKGVAGHALYTSGAGEHQKHHILNTCPRQTKGCGGGLDADGIADAMKGVCFAPKSENIYPGASVRRATHAQAKHDPAMTKDWILAHTHSLRNASDKADKENKRMLFRPNITDESDTTSRLAIKHLNEQRAKSGKPSIIGNSYGKTSELHDPKNDWHVTYSNTGPKVKNGKSISENAARDKERRRETITAVNNDGKDKVNDNGDKTPPKNSYAVIDVHRHSDMEKKFKEHVNHVKYWSSGREEHQITEREKQEGHEGHYDGNGKPTTPQNAHYGHVTIKGSDGKNRRYDYQKQHVLHPRLVKNSEGKLIPTDSRFKDNDFLPADKDRYKSKNGKVAGAVLLTTPTESTTKDQHKSSFTHHVGDDTIEHAKRNNGEYEIDNPHEQEKARGKEYVPPIGQDERSAAQIGSTFSDEELKKAIRKIVQAKSK